MHFVQFVWGTEGASASRLFVYVYITMRFVSALELAEMTDQKSAFKVAHYKATSITDLVTRDVKRSNCYL